MTKGVEDGMGDAMGIDKSEGVASGVFAVADPSPLPLDEKFTIWLDEEGDYMIQSQREPGLQADATTPEDAVWRMRQLLDMAATLKSPTKGVEDGMGELCKCGHSRNWHSLSSTVWIPSSMGCLAADGECKCSQFTAAVPVAILSAPVESANGIGKVFGTWPGDETDGQLLAALSEVRKPATTEVRGKASPEMEQKLHSALERLRNNAQHIFDAKSVRDWCETLAEADAALEAYRHHIEGKG